MEKRKQTVVKLAQTALLAALCFVSFTFLQIKIDAGWRCYILISGMHFVFWEHCS